MKLEAEMLELDMYMKVEPGMYRGVEEGVVEGVVEEDRIVDYLVEENSGIADTEIGEHDIVGQMQWSGVGTDGLWWGIKVGRVGY